MWSRTVPSSGERSFLFIGAANAWAFATFCAYLVRVVTVDRFLEQNCLRSKLTLPIQLVLYSGRSVVAMAWPVCFCAESQRTGG